MKIKHTLIIGSLVCVSVAAIAQEKKTTTKPAPAKASAAPAKVEAPSPEAAEKAWMAYMTPGEMHKMLMADEGEWQEDLTFWMAPGQPPTTAEATFTNKSVFEGRYMESFHRGTMMGMPFEGRSIIGYNNVTKMFESTWFDNMSTGIMYMKGTYDSKKNSITYIGKSVDPVSGKEIPARQVFTINDENSRVLEMYETRNGKEMKTMAIKMTRK